MKSPLIMLAGLTSSSDTWWWTLAAISFSLANLVCSIVVYRTWEFCHLQKNKSRQHTLENEKLLEAKTLLFLTTVSHEFRTPLTLIISPVTELLQTCSEHDKENLTIVQHNARRLLGLADRFLIFSKADSDPDPLKIASLDIVSLCRAVFICFNTQACNKNIYYKCSFQAEKIELFADREKLEIALFNLLSNAIKFTGSEGSVTLSITQTAHHVLIKIRDSGCGIPKHAGNNIFNRFYKSESFLSPVKGFGIGLYLVKKFIEDHKGSIRYHSKMGTGSVFKIRLLKGRDHFSEDVLLQAVSCTSAHVAELTEGLEDLPAKLNDLKPDKSTDRGLPDPFSKSILIVDDHEEIRAYLRKIFSEEFLVYEAADALAALKLVRENLPDMVIADVLMPGMSGIELCCQMKTDPFLNHIPIILLTAGASSENKLRGIEGGADDYITKPFEKELLLARVTSILKTKNNLQAYFHNEITLRPNQRRIPADYQAFIKGCIRIVEAHMADPDFAIKILTDEMGMSHSTLYKKVRSVSGQSLNGFIRSIRLRKAASLFLDTDCTVSEASYAVGINDLKYFREQFSKLFGINPSEYIKKFRAPFHATMTRNASRLKAVKNPQVV